MTTIETFFVIIAVVCVALLVLRYLERALRARTQSQRDRQPAWQPPAAVVNTPTSGLFDRPGPWAPNVAPIAARSQLHGEYIRVARLLSIDEHMFFHTLQKAVPPGYTIHGHVALQRLIRPKTHEWGRHTDDEQFMRLAPVSLDFVIVRESDMLPLLAVVLDYAAQITESSDVRSTLFDSILADAGLPIIHHRVLPQYDRMALQSQILGYLQRS